MARPPSSICTAVFFNFLWSARGAAQTSPGIAGVSAHDNALPTLSEVAELAARACPEVTLALSRAETPRDLVRACDRALEAKAQRGRACDPERDGLCVKNLDLGTRQEGGSSPSRVLLGWYLLAPPYGEDLKPNYRAPLGQWSLWVSSDTAKQCERKREESLKRTPGDSNAPGVEVFFARASAAVCIASDDPRLRDR